MKPPHVTDLLPDLSKKLFEKPVVNPAPLTYRHQLMREELARLERERAQHEQSKKDTEESHHRKKILPRDEDETPALQSGEYPLPKQDDQD